MKELILVRHAKSSWKDPALSDHERPLNKRGKRDAPEMGERLARSGSDPDLIVSSSAVRALDTARTIAGKLGYPRERIVVEERLFHAGVAELLQVIRGVDDSVDILMLFGHNPGLTDLANHIGPREIFNMPTCAVLHLRFESESWTEVGTIPIDEVMYDFPKSNLCN
ncbi:MAG: histidine phosphatase family protein [Gemmatimonadetes bacterium]|nr:histidine phosphatase family protein [Gemmatimonadota bacterium]MYA78171.1 histidine phosphatase family protein [Gemmatimonadota bacterium]MYG16563.1 histidine phosphatase family protein [Gemmatimonadota bacterium]MYH17832.1 histidine phosphatase family protein [Gemmatimonadota bacterium]MYK98179.1 histidine phosphatase family protein [Gemmatimonadota bacterium]